MSDIVSANTSYDYKVLIEFDDGSSINYNMQKLVNTLPYFRLKDLDCFLGVKFDEKSVFWEPGGEKQEYFPLRLSIDTILFSLR